MTLEAVVARRLGGLDLDVSLTAGDGEVVAVLGPNGAGKTTLLRCLAGLERVGRGRVRLGGTLLEDTERGVREPPARRGIGVVFQEHVLFPHLSALDNVAFGPRSRGTGRAEARRAAFEWLDRMELAAQATARPAALSGGQAQRVALARALAAEPRLLLLDEPLASLDADSRQAVRRLLRRHLDVFPGPCVLVTHEPLEAITLADRLVILEGGRITQDGPVAEVARRPRSEWVAKLVGLNLYRGHADGHRVTLDGGAGLHSAARADGDVYAVIHPQAVALHREAPGGSPRNTWSGTVEAIDLHDDHVRVQLAGPTPIVAQITPAALAELRIAEGSVLWVAVKATEVELYAR